MAIKEGIDSYTFVDEGNDLSTSNDVITMTTWKTHTDKGIYYTDKGAGAIVDGYSYDMFFELSAFPSSSIFEPFMTSNGIGDLAELRAGADDTLSVSFQVLGAANSFHTIHDYGAGVFEFETNSFTLILNNAYKVNPTRSGQTIIATLYDIDGGHGTPGAIVSTNTLVNAQTLEDHRYLYALSGLDDDSSVDETSGTVGPLFDVTPHVEISDSQALRMVNGGTIACQMSPDSTGVGAEGRLIDKDDGSTNGYAIMTTGTNQIQLSVGGVDSITGNNVYTNSVFTLVVAEFTAAGRRMWVNNVEVALTNSSDSTLPGDVAGSVFIGTRSSGLVGGFDGPLDELPIWDRKLTDTEREQIYNGGLALAIV
ncbi:MAG: LamG domain-containing protein [Candidatus Peribacteraceae bacterium]|nr:LamG domain-containing protein [Candidatus Peribacteraceae bacterium]